MSGPATPPIGDLLRSWRERRRMTQMELALAADVSTRHVSFVETGRSQPSREMVLHLAEELAVPLRERNRLLLAAGFAPRYEERALDDPALVHARDAVHQVLTGHEPYPALAIDRRWIMAAANRAVMPMLEGLAPELLVPPVNVLRLSLHPHGLAPRIVNAAEWRAHLLARARRQLDLAPDEALRALLDEAAAYPIAADPIDAPLDQPVGTEPVVPLRLRTPIGILSFISTTTVFGSPVEVTLSELAIEAFFPADAATGEALRQLVLA
jgi:transcriptional regulator with XRE-family HTH domain